MLVAISDSARIKDAAAFRNCLVRASRQRAIALSDLLPDVV